MSDDQTTEIGTIAWIDLTVENAPALRDFYCQVTGWQATPHPMGDYDDYDIKTPAGDKTVTGICHARNSNANVPPQWMIYITVEDIDHSVARCLELGGKIIDGPRQIGHSRFCVIQDPAGAVAALIS
jgi:hypothetical protein